MYKAFLKQVSLAAAALCVIAIGVTGTPATAELDQKQFKVVGTWSFLDHWKEREGPFWNDRLPSLSGGKLTANAKSQTELGLSGFEIMRLLKLGWVTGGPVRIDKIAESTPAQWSSGDADPRLPRRHRFCKASTRPERGAVPDRYVL